MSFIDPTQPPAPTTPKRSKILANTIGKDSSGKDILQYTLENDKNVKVELLSIGARLNSLKLSPTGSELVPGFTSTQVDNTNGSVDADSKFGAIDGPICGELANSMHTINYDGETDETTGEVKFMTTAANMDVVVTYSLSEDNKITVQISATSAGNTETMVDMCSSMFFQLMTGTESADDHRLMLNADNHFASGSPTSVGGIYDYRSTKLVSVLIDYILLGNSNTLRINEDFLLNGAPGLRKAAEYALFFVIG
ncbi:hypothetical protein EB796_001449 [Bugula neritina]|uniref:Uncharacterized protein n=1 Tax=Bugula neritina TaxID=10212 RepID=A0A7J7KQ72_BUGNE|nr:hypothetical protein EB796_001449 [Bugula neritina]